jgi:anti-sigma factor RsiW
MKDCAEIRERLSAYIDDEILAQERARIEEHLRHCNACVLELTSLRQINELLDSMPNETPAPAFTLKAVHRAASWMQCDYVKEHVLRPAMAYLLAMVSFVFYFEAGAFKKRQYPVYGHLRNFDDFPPESLSSIYVDLIQKGSK